jgi:hypothetical protein
MFDGLLTTISLALADHRNAKPRRFMNYSYEESAGYLAGTLASAGAAIAQLTQWAEVDGQTIALLRRENDKLRGALAKAQNNAAFWEAEYDRSVADTAKLMSGDADPS